MNGVCDSSLLRGRGSSSLPEWAESLSDPDILDRSPVGENVNLFISKYLLYLKFFQSPLD